MWKMKDKVLREAIDTYGVKHQITKAVEEMSELQQVLCRALEQLPDDVDIDTVQLPPSLLNHIFEEMADVLIVWAQLSLIFNNYSAIDNHKNMKLARLAQRILEIKQED